MGHARRPSGWIGYLAAVCAAVAVGAGCRTPDAPGPALLGRAKPAPEHCAPDRSTDAVQSLSFTSLNWMGEPMLACGPFAEDEAYRFILQSVQRSVSPVSVRLSRTEGQAILIARRYAWSSTPSSPQPLSVVASKVRPVTDAEWADLVEAVRRADFWSMQMDGGAVASADAPTWDLEGRVGRGYHHVERSSPPDGPFRDLALHVLRLAGYDAPLDVAPHTP